MDEGGDKHGTDDKESSQREISCKLNVEQPLDPVMNYTVKVHNKYHHLIRENILLYLLFINNCKFY